MNERVVIRKEEVKVKRNQFVMVKNAVGRLAVELTPYDFSTTARKIVFNFDEERQYVPLKWALGVFVSNQALKQMRLNYFTFEDLDELIRMAEEEGLYVPDAIKNKKVSLREIKEILLRSKPEEVKNMLAKADRKTVQDVVAVAQANYSSLQVDIVQTIEKTLNISVRPINLN